MKLEGENQELFLNLAEKMKSHQDLALRIEGAMQDALQKLNEVDRLTINSNK